MDIDKTTIRRAQPGGAPPSSAFPPRWATPRPALGRSRIEAISLPGQAVVMSGQW